MLTCIAALLLVGAAFIVWQWTNLRLAMVKSLSIHAEIIAENCKAALAFEDVKDAEETLKALHVEPSIVFACIRSSSGKDFAHYYRYDVDKSIHPPEFQQEGYVFGDGYLTVFKDIVLDGEVIGALCLRSDLYPLYVRLKLSTGIIIAVLLLASLVAYFVSSRLQKVISGPILRLAEGAARIGEGKLNHRVKIRSKDELGHLAQSFNDMAGKLKESYASLEKKVQERTSELSSANEKLEVEIVERKQAEERQAQLLEEIESINQELKDFAYIISHDLKAPLRGIKTLVDWITTDYADKLDEEGGEQMNLLSGRVDRMHNLIDGVLEYSRVGRVKEKMVQINLDELVREIIDSIAPRENIEITVENELPVVVCEQTRIIQVFQNLLSNAVKYMDKPQGQVRIGCVEEDGFWKFSVADNGPGIEEKYFEKIFQMFQTLSPRDEFESTGVGLSMVKKIVELYGGKIWVESEPGKGSTFFFTLSKQEMGVKDAKYEANIVSRR